MATIFTRYIGPTDHHGARISVTRRAFRERMIVPYDYSAHDAHDAAVVAFCKRFAIDGKAEPIPNLHTLVRGESPDGRGLVYLSKYDNVSVHVVNNGKVKP